MMLSASKCLQLLYNPWYGEPVMKMKVSELGAFIRSQRNGAQMPLANIWLAPGTSTPTAP